MNTAETSHRVVLEGHARLPSQHCARLRAQRARRLCGWHRLSASRRSVRLVQSGNSTRMGVSLAEGQFHAAAEALGLIALFVLGAACGSLIVLGRSRYSQSEVLL